MVQVELVGQVLKVQPSATNVVFCVDDGTSNIDVRVYADQDDANSFQVRKTLEITEGMYVRVVGSLRAFGEKRSVVGYRLLPVHDFNEVTYHFLNAIHVHLVHTRGGGAAQPAGYGMVPNFMQRQPQHVPAMNPNPQAMRQDIGGLNSLQMEALMSHDIAAFTRLYSPSLIADHPRHQDERRCG